MTKKRTPTPTPTEDPDATADLLDRAKALKERAHVEGWSNPYVMSRIHSMNRARGDLFEALRLLALAKKCGFLTGEGLELGREVLDVSGVGG